MTDAFDVVGQFLDEMVEPSGETWENIHVVSGHVAMRPGAGELVKQIGKREHIMIDLVGTDPEHMEIKPTEALREQIGTRVHEQAERWASEQVEP